MKTQTKFAILFFSVISVTLVLLSAGIYYFTTRYAFNDFYKRLEIRAVVMARSMLDHEEASKAVLQEVREMHLERLPDEREFYFKVEPGAGFTAASMETNLPVSFFNQVAETGEATFNKGDTFYAGILYEAKSGNHIVIVSADNYNNVTLLSYLRKIFLGGIVIALLLGLAISIVISRRVFDPVKEISNRVREISSQNLHLRLDTKDQADEISELSRTFNKMLDRLETAFATQNNFVSNASHELNTPLTAIIGQAEVTLSKDRSREDYEQSLRVILSRAERLHEITRSLLYLAQTGFKGRGEEFDHVRADQLLWDVKTMIDKIHPDNQVQLNLSLMPENPERLRIRGNERLLQIALSNILSNAIKYSGNKPVTMSIGTTDNDVVIVINDQGIGIPPQDLKFIFDPFYRASNTKSYEGYGIGLPLTRNIVRLHEGLIQVNSRENTGTDVQLNFPIDRF